MLDILQYDFMQRAFVAGLVIAIIAPVIGVFLVTRRYSLLADTLAHVSLVGVAASAFVRIDPLVGALISSCLAAFGIEKLRETQRLFSESILALFLSGSLAAALILFGVAKHFNAGILSYLFGSITTVSFHDVIVISICGLVVMCIVGFLWKSFFLISYDEELAKANGMPVRFLSVLLTLLAAVSVSLSMRVVGTLLVGALMVIPVLTAIQWGTSFCKTTMYAMGFSITSVILGLMSSFYVDIPSGAAIVMMTIIFFVGSVLFTKKRLSH